ncbi:hypothetical protein GCM10010236_80560 [Streptomyces eurythermus]|nr:hypothetical protein GCM10010236_80560 [Streptomyces eurythermus]
MDPAFAPSAVVGDLIRWTEDRLERERELLERLRAIDASAPAGWQNVLRLVELMQGGRGSPGHRTRETTSAARARHRRRSPRRRTDIADGHLAGGRVEAAFALASRALEAGLQYRSGRVVERARGVRRSLTTQGGAGLRRTPARRLPVRKDHYGMRVGITGHRGLSTLVEEQVRALLADQVSQYDPAQLVGVSCIADGPDSWFAETVL